METQATATLVKLDESNHTVMDPKADIRGRGVLDSQGDEIGKVDDLMIDDREHKVRFLLVGSGGFLGLGETKVLIPIDAITRITEDVVYINQAREHVARAPRYDPAIVIDQNYWDNAYSHYCFRPHWDPDYIYPEYPYYNPY